MSKFGLIGATAPSLALVFAAPAMARGVHRVQGAAHAPLGAPGPNNGD
jgi:hypothetical protein